MKDLNNDVLTVYFKIKKQKLNLLPCRTNIKYLIIHKSLLKVIKKNAYKILTYYLLEKYKNIDS